VARDDFSDETKGILARRSRTAPARQCPQLDAGQFRDLELGPLSGRGEKGILLDLDQQSDQNGHD